MELCAHNSSATSTNTTNYVMLQLHNHTTQ